MSSSKKIVHFAEEDEITPYESPPGPSSRSRDIGEAQSSRSRDIGEAQSSRSRDIGEASSTPTAWTRPDGFLKQCIWDEFQIKIKGHFCRERVENFVIQDILRRDIDICVNFLKRHILNEEKMINTFGLIVFDDECEEKLRDIVQYYVDQDLCIGCFTVQNNKIKDLVALNIHLLKQKGGSDEEEINKVKNPILNVLTKHILYKERNVNFFEMFAVNSYLASRGLLVRPSYRRKDIGFKMMEARKKMCEQFEIPAALDLYVEPIGVALGSKCRYISLDILSSKELRKRRITVMKCEGITLMGIKYKFNSPDIPTAFDVSEPMELFETESSD